MNQKTNLPRHFSSKLFFISALIFALSASLTSGALPAATADETAAQTRNGNDKTTAATPKKTIPKTASKATPKTSPKTSPKTTAAQNGQSFIVSGFKVLVRDAPKAGAANVAQIGFGTLVRSVESGSRQDVLNGKTGYWHKIALINNKQGWVFGAYLKPFTQANAETIYKEITAEKFKFAKRSFDENAELYDFLTRVQADVKTPANAAQIGFWRLLALKGALAAIPFERKDKSPYKDFINRNEINIVYSEPSGEYYVKSDRFWSLSKKYAALPIGERIAWEAARNPLPGECEGYLNCYLYKIRATHGEYLARFPKGSHAAESLKAIGDQLAPIVADAQKKEIYATPTDVSDRADFYKTIAELRSIVSRTGFFEKEAVLKQLDKIADGYR
jgi:hypothetical protein